MKYIDVEKLKEVLASHYQEITVPVITEQGGVESYFRRAEIHDILNIITSLQQEQPEVDLEKFTEKIKTFQARYKHPESISVKGAMAFMARMFYQYPNVARQWYDGLPKATMDDARKEE